jgi:ketosteroid isomerase-like protein
VEVIVSSPLEDRIRTELRDVSDAVDLRAGDVASMVEHVFVRRRQRRIRALAVVAGVIAIMAVSGALLDSQGRDDTSPPALDRVTIQTLRDTEESRLDALVAADMPGLEQLHADDFELVPPTGSPLSREAYLDAVAAGDLDFRAYEAVTPIEVRLYGDTAVLRYKSHLDVRAVGEGRLTHGSWHTCLYENHDGDWQVVWEQTTAVGAFPPPY